MKIICKFFGHSKEEYDSDSDHINVCKRCGHESPTATYALNKLIKDSLTPGASPEAYEFAKHLLTLGFYHGANHELDKELDRLNQIGSLLNVSIAIWVVGFVTSFLV